jgi:two-component system sensor histidine kinase UhpB
MNKKIQMSQIQKSGMDKKEVKKNLRLRAEKELDSKMNEIENLSSQDLKHLIHELNVHQIELELQNEELKEARIQLEQSLEKYSNLYNLAPVAYLSLDKNGQIEDINITGSNMLCVEKRYLVKKRFQSFIIQEHKDRFHMFLSRIFSSSGNHVCELEIIDKRNRERQVKLIGSYLAELSEEGSTCKMAMVDITDQNAAREIIKSNIEEKERLNVILKTQEQERKRIAESLHNGIGQTLYAAKLKLDQYLNEVNSSSKIEELRNLLMDAINDVKVISFELIPVILEDFGLETVLIEMCRKFSREDEINFFCNVYGYESRLDITTEIAIYRIIQELVNNIIKHSKASEGKIFLTITDNIIIRVDDNGKGFSGIEALNQAEGMGLKNIRNRVKLLDGTIDFTPGASKGTSVIINLPLRR